MGTLFSASQHKIYLIFLNISFLLVASVVLIIHFSSSQFLHLNTFKSVERTSEENCQELQKLDGNKAKCLHLKSNSPCVSEGYINYLYLFYCNFGNYPSLGFCLIFLWLLILLYLLGNTASEYFCTSLESLSRLLNLSPTIAGVTLLSLGNGAPDVFSTLVSFMGRGTSDIGLNSVLGGASFVNCVVFGIISICLRSKSVQVIKYAFIRDSFFLILVLVFLVVILISGKINLWGAIGFFSMYVVYVIVVYISLTHCHNGGEESEKDAASSCDSGSDSSTVPILIVADERELEEVTPTPEDETKIGAEEREVNCLVDGTPEDKTSVETKSCCFCLRSLSSSFNMIIYILEMPLYLPRRLTIPVVCEKRWSKPIAITSVTLAPLLLSALWVVADEKRSFRTVLLVNGIGLLSGIAFGVIAYLTTEKSSPPQSCLFPWLAGGFLMSVTWSYITAQELVGLLVSVGYILGIRPAILGLTVLAWGNSLGDLVTNLTMAMKGEAKGAQVAISGCYAGPIFNILFGLGLSLVGSCWLAYPSSVTISKDSYLLETLGLFVCALLWALVVLSWRGMTLDGVLGGGLVAIYLISLSLRLFQALGFLHFQNQHT